MVDVVNNSTQEGGGGAKRTTSTSAIKGKMMVGESHRIYWHQWIIGNSSNNNIETNSTTATTTPGVALPTQQPQPQQKSRRSSEFITSSAAVRISRNAKVIDLTQLLRKTLQLPQLHNDNTITTTSSQHDCLVLVGTLYSLPRGFVQYEHEIQQHQQPSISTTTAMINDDPFHIVRTLQPHESPLQVRDEMEQHLKRFLVDHSSELSALSQQQPPLLESSVSSSSTTTSTTGIPSTTTPMMMIPPKLQWYYVPTAPSTSSSSGTSSSTTTTIMPNCVELDGYCTSTEDDDDNSISHDDDYDNDDETNNNGMDGTVTDDGSRYASKEDQDTRKHLYETFPWLVIPPEKIAALVDSTSPPPQQQKHETLEKRVLLEEQRLEEMTGTSSQQQPQLRGYLLKRDHRDIHVWRRVYCVLSNNDLWFVSRIYTKTTTTTTSNSDTTSTTLDAHSESIGASCIPPKQCSYRYAKHGRISLTRALLLEPTPDHLPLYRTPYAFEITSSRGTSHVFRASCKQEQQLWISAISDVILLSHENSLLQHAELIVADECRARSKRMTASVVVPLWDEAMRVTANAATTNDSKSLSIATTTSLATSQIPQQQRVVVSPTVPSLGNSIGSVLRFGMDVALYRDRCRYISSSMPAKSPVLVVSTPPRRRFFAAPTAVLGSMLQQQQPQPEPLDVAVRDMIRTTWIQASALLSRATSLALTLQVRSSLRHTKDGKSVRLSHGIDTLCRHIDFVITGRSLLHPKDNNNNDTTTAADGLTTAATTNVVVVPQDNDSPPPGDLFDQLLVELQSLAAAADCVLLDHHHHHQHDLVRTGQSASSV